MTEAGGGRDAAFDRVEQGLLEAITLALQAFAGDDEGAALRDSFRAVSAGVKAQRSFLARVDAQRHVTTVLASEGLAPEQVEALRAGTSSPGVSPSLVRAALATGRARVVEDARLASRRGEVTGSLATGDYSVVCATVSDPYTRAPVAVFYLQTSSVTEPLTRALVPYVEAYTMALSHAWHVWDTTQRVLGLARAERAAGGVIEIVGDSEATRALRERVLRILIPAMAAERPDPILILGPTGSGKEVLARYLHAYSARARGRFVALNCAAFAGEVLESTLFGHTRGAFTGAVAASEGMFMAADNGVLFLDEVGDMPVQGQSLLLRALEARSVRPVGGRDERRVNVQLVCATNKDIEAEMRAGRFRDDLFHRVQGLTVRLTPLSQRLDDVRPLLSHYLRLHERRLRKRTLGLTREAAALLLRYAWPGNVRELGSVCSALVLHAQPARLIDEHVLAEAAPQVYETARRPRRRVPALPPVDWAHGSLAQARLAFTRAYVTKVGRELGWNKTVMAQRLGLNRSALHRILKRCGVKEDNADER